MLECPLAEKMRPRSLDEVVGQEHLIGKNGVIRLAIEKGNIPSMILWGPPGVGKTTLANIMAVTLQKQFFQLSAISSGVKEVREVIDLASKTAGAILFIDEIHRFNKSQQDALLNAVEKGIITLIGATTENPSFEVNAALLSRCQVYILKSLTETDLLDLLNRAVAYIAQIKGITIELQELEALMAMSNGDARKLLNLFSLVLEVLQRDDNTVIITNQQVMNIAQQNIAIYDKNGDQHYEVISAFIKSLRGSDPNAAIYWLARMLVSGEDVKFIARRMIIFASEDIGNANPNALLLANATFDAVAKIGMPEARIILAQCATYLASSTKSNASYVAINHAMDWVKKTNSLPVPLHLRNSSTPLMKKNNFGKEYLYPHDYPDNFVIQEYLPEGLEGTVFYTPGNAAREREMKKYLSQIWGEKYGYEK